MKQLLFIIGCTLAADFLKAQNVGIGTTAPAEKLKIKNAHRSTVKIGSNNFTDTSQLIFSNRDASSAGTDFLITSNQEQGLSLDQNQISVPIQTTLHLSLLQSIAKMQRNSF
jgi:hypothetical protein